MDDIIFVGLDAHKATVAVAVAEGTRDGEVRHLGAIPNRADHKPASLLMRDGFAALPLRGHPFGRIAG
jgi:hypothetical protein